MGKITICDILARLQSYSRDIDDWGRKLRTKYKVQNDACRNRLEDF